MASRNPFAPGRGVGAAGEAMASRSPLAPGRGAAEARKAGWDGPAPRPAARALASRREFLRLSGLALAGLAVPALAGCVNQHPNGVAARDGAAQTARLIATSPAVAAVCDKLELDLVGVCSTTTSTIPDRYRDLPQVGTAMAPDMEIVKSLNPDYVLGPDSLESDLMPKYKGIHVASIFLNMRSVDGMYASMTDLGNKFGRQTQASAANDEYQSFMDEYKSRNEGKESPKCLVLMGLPGSYLVATEHSYVGSLVKLAGGTNVYSSDSGDQFLNVNTEDMQTKDPDIILRTAHALPDQVVEMFKKEFAENDIWKHFRAVQDGRVFDLTYDHFGMSATFNYPEALDELEPELYPNG